MAPMCGERSGICQRRNTNHSSEIVQRHTETFKVTGLDQANPELSTTYLQSRVPEQNHTPKEHFPQHITSPIHRRSSGGDSSAAVGISLGAVFFVTILLIMCYLYCRTCHQSSDKKSKKDKDKKKDKKDKKDKDKKGKKKNGKEGKKRRRNCPRDRDHDPARVLREWLAQNPEFVANTMPRIPRQAYVQGRANEFRPVNEMDAPQMVYSDEEENVAHHTDHWLMWSWYLANEEARRRRGSSGSSSDRSSSS